MNADPTVQNAVVSALEQARLFVQQHAPSELMREALPFGIVCVVAGIGVSVLGAKLARVGLTGLFMLLGAGLGVFCARQGGWPAPVCALIGAAILGFVAFQTFRFWVGMAAAMVLATVAAGAFGYERVVPHMQEFERTRLTTTASQPLEGRAAFTVPTPAEQEAYVTRTPQQWLGDLWRFVAERDATAAQTARAWVLAAGIVGLFLGVVAARWALIISAAVVGTSLLTTGGTTLLSCASPEVWRNTVYRPALMGLLIGAIFVASLVVQTMLTRQPKSEKDTSKD